MRQLMHIDSLSCGVDAWVYKETEFITSDGTKFNDLQSAEKYEIKYREEAKERERLLDWDTLKQEIYHLSHTSEVAAVNSKDMSRLRAIFRLEKEYEEDYVDLGRADAIRKEIRGCLDGLSF